jgi:hypothetical protein
MSAVSQKLACYFFFNIKLRLLKIACVYKSRVHIFFIANQTSSSGHKYGTASSNREKCLSRTNRRQKMFFRGNQIRSTNSQVDLYTSPNYICIKYRLTVFSKNFYYLLQFCIIVNCVLG